MLFAIRILMVLTLLSAFHLHLNTKNKMLTDKIYGVAIFSFLLHVCMIFPVYFFAKDSLYIEGAAPFNLAYGPFFYLYQRAELYGRLRLREIVWHTLPIVPYWVLYFVYVLNSEFREAIGMKYFMFVFGSIAVSLIGYSVYMIYIYHTKHIKSSLALLLFYLYLTIFGILMALVVMQLFEVSTSTRTIVSVSIFMLLGTLLVFSDTFHRFRQQYNFVREKTLTRSKSNSSQIFAKSVQLLKYSREELEAVDSFFASDAVRDINLTLKSAALQLNMTQKMLTEIIAEQYNTTFSKLLAIKRIELACDTLLMPDFDGSYDKVISTSGFGSAASFYRNFRQLKNCSPMEFRSNILSETL